MVLLVLLLLSSVPLLFVVAGVAGGDGGDGCVYVYVIARCVHLHSERIRSQPRSLLIQRRPQDLVLSPVNARTQVVP